MKMMKNLLLIALLLLTLGATDSIFAQKLENNCAIAAWITDKDPNGLNVRDKPTASGKAIGKLKQGTDDDDLIMVYIVGYSNGWAKISGAERISGDKVFEGIGWVSAKMVAVSTQGVGGKDDSLAPLYEKPNKSSRKIGSIPNETEVQMIGYDCFGLKVSYKGKIGWLSTDNLCGNPVTTCS